MKSKKKKFPWQAIVLVVLAIPFFLPLYISFVNTFKESKEIVSSPLSIAIPPFLENLKYALTAPDVGIGGMYLNSIILSVFGTLITVIVSIYAGYFIARSKHKAVKVLRTYFMAGLMVPYVIVYIPLVMMLRKCQIPLNIYTLIFVFVSGNISFAVFMYSNFIKALPIDLEEAAILDGATTSQILWRIVFPLLKPCTATVCIFVFLGVWNDFMTPLLLGQIKTITVGIYTVIGPHSADWGMVFSYVFLASVPMVILFLCFQDQFISGLTKGATKG